eukprot:304367_1
MCASTAPLNTPISELEIHVNHSNCVTQTEIIEFYILSDWKDSMYGNYNILGKVIELNQATSPHQENIDEYHNFSNTTRFEELPVCHINIYQGYVTNITCDSRGVGYNNSIQQFDMLHDIMRYLLPRLQRRLYEGFDIGEDNLFGYSTMNREYENNSTDNLIKQEFKKENIKNETYGNATTELLWNHQSTIGAYDTEVKHMNFSLIHVFSQLPSNEESEYIKLFTWAGYQLQLLNKQEILPNKIQQLKELLENTADTKTKTYTLEEWRGMRPGDYLNNKPSLNDNEDEQTGGVDFDEEFPNTRRRLGGKSKKTSWKKIRDTICKYVGGGSRKEEQINFYQTEIWASQLMTAIKKPIDALTIANTFLWRWSPTGKSGMENDKGLIKRRGLYPIIPGFLEPDVGLIVSAGFHWNYKIDPKKQAKLKQEQKELDNLVKGSAFVFDNPRLLVPYCPAQIRNTVSYLRKFYKTELDKDFKKVIIECCERWYEAAQDCDKTLKQAYQIGENCLKEKMVCRHIDKLNKNSKAANIADKMGSFEFKYRGAPNMDQILTDILAIIDVLILGPTGHGDYGNIFSADFWTSDRLYDLYWNLIVIIQQILPEPSLQCANWQNSKGKMIYSWLRESLISKLTPNGFSTGRGFESRVRGPTMAKKFFDTIKEYFKFKDRSFYWKIKSQKCQKVHKHFEYEHGIKKVPHFKMDFVFSTNPTFGNYLSMSDLCTGYFSQGFQNAIQRRSLVNVPSRRRRLIYTNTGTISGLYAPIPLVPPIDLPCIPIAPPGLQLCPGIFVGATIGLGTEPKFEEEYISLYVNPSASLDIVASLALRIGPPVFYAQIEMGIAVSIIILQLPTNVNLNLKTFGLYGDVNFDFKLLELSIYLKF